MSLNSWRMHCGLVLMSAMAVLAQAQQTDPESLVQYVPPSLLRTNTMPQTPAKTAAEPDEAVALIAPANHSAAQRREAFEAEFGIQHPSPSFFAGSLESVLYRANDAIFTAKDFIEHNLNFTYELRNLGRSVNTSQPPRHIRESFWRDAWENARFESRISLGSSTHDLIGIRLVVPIGN